MGFNSEAFDVELDIAVGKVFKVIDTYYEKRVAVEIKQIILDLIKKYERGGIDL